jgi:PTS system N-acetylgalactosamine-specific IIB component
MTIIEIDEVIVMTNHIFTRIDSRLIHGQITYQWLSVAKTSFILVVNDALAENTFSQNLMKASIQNQVEVKFVTVQDAMDDFPTSRDVFVICDCPQDMLRLVQGGIPIRSVNVGNMRMSAGKKQVASSIAVDQKDIDAFCQLKDAGVELFIQRVPGTEKEDTRLLFEE